ncbi:hypothetical protein [Aquimarina rubra]|uniref:Class I SAM-dependent methyltransferase n=1 Tax=Aquimarina rubra TaxID=1920033 RepID=A0ABW5LDU8_9FLAO
MLFKFKSYLNFLWKSTNQHGVHSPFVYNLVTKCFYDRKERASYNSIKNFHKNNTLDISLKNAKLLNRLIPYLDYKKILILSDSSDFITQILSVNNQISISDSLEVKHPFDFIYMDIAPCENNPELLETIFSLVHNDSLLLFNEIHKSQSNQFIWEQLQNNSKTKVTIDTYDLGFVFFRREQEKEHFIIRV